MRFGLLVSKFHDSDDERCDQSPSRYPKRDDLRSPFLAFTAGAPCTGTRIPLRDLRVLLLFLALASCSFFSMRIVTVLGETDFLKRGGLVTCTRDP